jgi:hypothetical protein
MFRETLMQLNRCRVPYVVSGAFALQVHTGIWRATKDLDLFLTPEDVPAALRCLRKNGFRCEVKDPVWLHKAHRHGFFIDLGQPDIHVADRIRHDDKPAGRCRFLYIASDFPIVFTVGKPGHAGARRIGEAL